MNSLTDSSQEPHLKSDEIARKVRVSMVTMPNKPRVADHELLDTMTPSDCGHALFAQKPFTEEVLLEKVRQALSTASPSDE